MPASPLPLDAPTSGMLMLAIGLSYLVQPLAGLDGAMDGEPSVEARLVPVADHDRVNAGTRAGRDPLSRRQCDTAHRHVFEQIADRTEWSIEHRRTRRG